MSEISFFTSGGTALVYGKNCAPSAIEERLKKWGGVSGGVVSGHENDWAIRVEMEDEPERLPKAVALAGRLTGEVTDRHKFEIIELEPGQLELEARVVMNGLRGHVA